MSLLVTFVYPTSDFVDGGLLEVELVLLHDVADLLLESLGLLVLDVGDEVDAGLAEYGHPVFGNSDGGPFGR